MNEIDEIRWQMAQIRRDLYRDVSEVVGSAERAFDWRSYPRDWPWLSAGVAFAVGYVLVPKRRVSARSVAVVPTAAFADNGDSATSTTTPVSASIVAANHDSTNQAVQSRPPLLSRAINLAWPVVVRAAQSYASTWVDDLLLRNHPAARSQQSSTSGGVSGTGTQTGAFDKPSRW